MFLYISARRKKENEEKLLLVMNCKKKKIVPGVGGVVGDYSKTESLSCLRDVKDGTIDV